MDENPASRLWRTPDENPVYAAKKFTLQTPAPDARVKMNLPLSNPYGRQTVIPLERRPIRQFPQTVSLPLVKRLQYAI
ncbi:MAG: hypothetical protein LBH85_08610 [Treponema sp.]|nr:hypothetical protein [Treponema sp.]